MTFEQWWAKQTANFDPSEIGLMQLARITWDAAYENGLENMRGLAVSACATVRDEGDSYNQNEDNHEDGHTDGCNNCAQAILEIKWHG